MNRRVAAVFGVFLVPIAVLMVVLVVLINAVYAANHVTVLWGFDADFDGWIATGGTPYWQTGRIRDEYWGDESFMIRIPSGTINTANGYTWDDPIYIRRIEFQCHISNTGSPGQIDVWVDFEDSTQWSLDPLKTCGVSSSTTFSVDIPETYWDRQLKLGASTGAIFVKLDGDEGASNWTEARLLKVEADLCFGSPCVDAPPPNPGIGLQGGGWCAITETVGITSTVITKTYQINLVNNGSFETGIANGWYLDSAITGTISMWSGVNATWKNTVGSHKKYWWFLDTSHGVGNNLMQDTTLLANKNFALIGFGDGLDGADSGSLSYQIKDYQDNSVLASGVFGGFPDGWTEHRIGPISITGPDEYRTVKLKVYSTSLPGSGGLDDIGLYRLVGSDVNELYCGILEDKEGNNPKGDWSNLPTPEPLGTVVPLPTPGAIFPTPIDGGIHLTPVATRCWEILDSSKFGMSSIFSTTLNLFDVPDVGLCLEPEQIYFDDPEYFPENQEGLLNSIIQIGFVAFAVFAVFGLIMRR